ncbi:chromate efflux transporter [Pseudarthrobacter enclensis]|uniref:Chromate transporter n=1 Tax=Pseudarthrobacter enclensis TaxID=993070 RepID=A0ABT9RZ08_9MICC|nr:chromate efflux transporter [Pseudarthrobacter enclensis]MDP9889868.1 chromate transporter [Pseudarthrobacter enclensis]
MNNTTGAGGEASGGDIPFRKFLLYFLHLGVTGFGGPIATVGYMQRDLVERRAWIDRQEFLDGVALGQAMPGPLAAQVAMWIGYLQRGAWGAFAVAAVFVGPAFVMVIAAGALYTLYSGAGIVQALFYGIAPAVMAIILIAAYKLLRLTDRGDWRLWAISAAVFSVTALTGSEPIPLIMGAGLAILFLDAPPDWRKRRKNDATGTGPPEPPSSHGNILVPALATAPMAALGTGGAAPLIPLGLFFLQTGALVFGSGLAIVPLLRDGVVDQHHWLDQAQFLDAVAIGLITPGPVVITAGFIGYLIAGFPGAFVATVAIFAPIYLAVVLLGRWFVRHRGNTRLRAFVAGATAAAAGALAGAVVVLTREAVTDPVTASIGLVTLGVLWRSKIPEPWIVLSAGVLGLGLHLLH